MTIALTIIFLMLLTGFLLVSAITPNRSRHSSFERKRRRESGHDMSLDDSRQKHATSVQSMLNITKAGLLMLLTLCAINLFDWFTGVLVLIVIVLFYGRVSGSAGIKRSANKLYSEQELRLLEFIAQHSTKFDWIKHDIPESPRRGFESKPELAHLIAADHTVLTPNERQLLIGSLGFADKTVSEVMTPVSDIYSIKKSEILGPLVLDDLHKSGFDSFPVTQGADNKDIVGIVRLRDVQTLDTSRKHTAKVESAMDPYVQRVKSTESLRAALELLLHSQQHLLIVVNTQDEVIGLVTLKDIYKILFGH